MRLAFFVLFALTRIVSAQLTDDEAKKTLEFVNSQYDPATGAFKVDAKSKPGLRATSGAVRIHGYLGADKLDVKLPDKAKTIAFVNSCYDATTGGFREPGGNSDVTITSIGLMACGELGIPKSQFPKAVEYLKANAKTFEDVRIGAAALESIKTKPDWLDAWIKLADVQLNNDGTAGKGDSLARQTASVAAMKLRLGYPLANKSKIAEILLSSQRSDGGWGLEMKPGSDLETSYRVMRALHLLKERPKDVVNLKAFLAKCRSTNGGYSVEPGNASTMSGTYYAAAISSWLKK